MKLKTRAQKLMALQNAMNGDTNALREHKRMQEPCFMVIYDTQHPEPADLVDTRLADAQGRKRVTYAEFLNNPETYGRWCIAV